MNFKKLLEKIKFFLYQNLKKQKFEKEFIVKFDKDIETFIKNYSSKIPPDLNINKNFDLLSNLEFRKRASNFETIKKIINDKSPLSYNNKNTQIAQNIEDINLNGITDINFLNLKESQIKKILYELDEKKRFKGHTIHHSTGDPIYKNQMKDNSFYCFETKEILKIKEVQDILNNQLLKDFIMEYFGCLPTLNSFNVYITTKTDTEKGVQHYHRDNEDFKTLNIFFLLRDTKRNDGGHNFIKGSHNPESMKKKIEISEFEKIKKIGKIHYNLEIKNIDDICNLPKDGYGFEKIYEVLKNNEIDVSGKAGRIFAEDNFGLHKSIKNSSERIIFWLSFSLTSVGTTRYCISHNIIRKFIPKRIKYSQVKENIKNTFFEKYVYRYYIDFLN